ncbi:hypothetical protein THRCLA_21743 [Thraustotheca clavata]|uniref:Protein kinase domain-containing protein n=1 Tax=Thraustotheca clavata TaxID=74557 RepID=A0A1V9ZQ53_9STRA|nr:hypothetical protein THRCLA_21743 [Thraustotheca clavata]
MAPEVITGEDYTEAADVYSFGVILSEFCTHEIPYANLRHHKSGGAVNVLYITNQVREGLLHPSFNGPNVPEWLPKLGLRCLSLDPSDRPSSLELTSYLSKAAK